MKRARLSLSNIAERSNVEAAAQRAAEGKRQRPPVQHFFADGETAVQQVQRALLNAHLPVGRYAAFRIRDPKPRLIHAAPFADRVAHHALMAYAGPSLDKALLDTSFACRINKGSHAAIYHAQRCSRRVAVWLKLDISGYFDHIDHRVLRLALRRRLKGDGLALLDTVIDSYSVQAGKGLPIGSLCSQHFANYYLNAADHWAIAQPQCKAHCRYMDDTLLGCASLSDGRALARGYAAFVAEHLQLQIKAPIIQRTEQGVFFCGVRIYPHRLLASKRRLRQARQRHRYWYQQWCTDAIDEGVLQRNTDAVLASLAPANTRAWQSCHWPDGAEV